MNLTALINFQSMKYIGAQTQASAIQIFVANSLRSLIQELFMQITPFFIVTISCRRNSPFNFYKNIMELLYNSVDNMIIQLVYLNHTQPIRIEGPRLHNLLLVDSLEAFLDMDIVSYTRYYNTNEYYHIFLQQKDIRIPKDMAGIFEYCWVNQLINCNVQIQKNNGDVFIYTYFPYTQDHCGHIVPVEINRYIGDRWKNNDLFPLKLRNFYKCPLKILLKPLAPFLMIETDERNHIIYTGLEGHLLNNLSKKLNFTIDPVIAQLEKKPMNMNRTSLNGILEGKAHMGIGYYHLRSDNIAAVTTTFPHHQSTLVASILIRTHNLTAFQILIFPFQLSSWMAILFSTILTIVTAIATKPALTVATGLFDILAITLGLPVSTAPVRTQKRFVYCSMLLGSLVLRAIYSALLYHLFRNHVHQPFPNTLLQLLHGDYQAVMARLTLQDISGVPYFDQFTKMRLTIFNASRTQTTLTMPFLEHQINDFAFAVTSRDYLLYYATLNHKPGLYYIVPESVLSQQLTICLEKHSHLVGQLDATLRYIQSAGLVNHWSRNQEKLKYFRSSHLYGQKLIGLHELLGVYATMSVIYGLATIVFLLELLSMKIQWLKRFLN